MQSVTGLTRAGSRHCLLMSPNRKRQWSPTLVCPASWQKRPTLCEGWSCCTLSRLRRANLACGGGCTPSRTVRSWRLTSMSGQSLYFDSTFSYVSSRVSKGRLQSEHATPQLMLQPICLPGVTQAVVQDPLSPGYFQSVLQLAHLCHAISSKAWRIVF